MLLTARALTPLTPKNLAAFAMNTPRSPRRIQHHAVMHVSEVGNIGKSICRNSCIIFVEIRRYRIRPCGFKVGRIRSRRQSNRHGRTESRNAFRNSYLPSKDRRRAPRILPSASEKLCPTAQREGTISSAHLSQRTDARGLCRWCTCAYLGSFIFTSALIRPGIEYESLVKLGKEPRRRDS